MPNIQILKISEYDMDEVRPLGDLNKALVAFQAECPSLSFDKTVKTEKYSFKYVTLAKMVNETKPILAKHGLAISHEPVISSREDHVRIKTILRHSSGDVTSSEFEMKISSRGQVTPQDVGSAISYAKRYAYGAILSLITDEDLDGHSPSEIYSGSKDDIAWLKETCKKLGVTDLAVMKAINSKMLEDNCTKDAKLIAKLID